MKKSKILKERSVTVRTLLFITITSYINIAMSIFKFILGVLNMSAWFLLNGAFKLIVGLVGLRAVRCCNEGNNSSEISYRRGAAVKLIILGIIYSFVSAHIYFESVTVGFTGYSVYAVASMTFWTLGNSIYGVVKYGKSRNPVLRSVKKTSIANALASVVLTQIVLLYEFGDGRDMSPANSLAAMAAGIAMIVMGLYDVLKE